MSNAFSLALCALLVSSPLAAQQRAPAPLASDAIADTDDMVLVGAVVVGTAALGRVDRALMLRVQDTAVVERRVLGPIARRLDFIGRPGSIILGGAAFAAGKLTGSDRLADLGLHDATALLVTEVSTRVLKGALGRARPDSGGGTFDFRLGRGWSKERGSFPSGHASSSFAAAAVVTGEMSRWSSPYTVPVGIVMYGGAAAVGLARIFENRHWATDVLAGAALGYLIGDNVVEHAYRDADDETEPAPSSQGGAASRLPPIPIFYMSIPSR